MWVCRRRGRVLGPASTPVAGAGVVVEPAGPAPPALRDPPTLSACVLR